MVCSSVVDGAIELCSGMTEPTAGSVVTVRVHAPVAEIAITSAQVPITFRLTDFPTLIMLPPRCLTLPGHYRAEHYRVQHYRPSC